MKKKHVWINVLQFQNSPRFLLHKPFASGGDANSLYKCKAPSKFVWNRENHKSLHFKYSHSVWENYESLNPMLSTLSLVARLRYLQFFWWGMSAWTQMQHCIHLPVVLSGCISVLKFRLICAHGKILYWAHSAVQPAPFQISVNCTGF